MSDAAIVDILEAALAYTQRIQIHRRAGERCGLRATPAFFLNGKVADVSFGLEKLDEAVQAALKIT
ncbi:hypothetical protein LNV08_20350 [Paucibacter sp. TC2R-5]|uniref:DsbA family protein n=1 Tax=Paucibacter sp. TC2R-5 TaxID=2893555 RepID=UPI0021E4CDCD|nr:hypothetical protein [Paucibacter sp. TC2R-5]MCV2361320.1 hypothetical protein [Paucibacter sp. TC2R-5]